MVMSLNSQCNDAGFIVWPLHQRIQWRFSWTTSLTSRSICWQSGPANFFVCLTRGSVPSGTALQLTQLPGIDDRATRVLDSCNHALLQLPEPLMLTNLFDKARLRGLWFGCCSVQWPFAILFLLFTVALFTPFHLGQRLANSFCAYFGDTGQSWWSWWIFWCGSSPFFCVSAFSAGETQIWPEICVVAGLCLFCFLHGSASFLCPSVSYFLHSI